MKEGLRTLGINIGKKALIRGSSLWSQQVGITNPQLRKEGKPYYKRLENGVRRREHVNPSEKKHIFDGYSYRIEGLENLEGVDLTNGVLFLPNHPKDGPLGGWAPFYLLNGILSEITGEEPTWVQGKGKHFMSILHEQIGATMRTVYLDNKNGKKDLSSQKKTAQPGQIELIRTMKQRPVGLFPEGEHSEKLQQGDYRAGHLILSAAKSDIPIICISTIFYGEVDENGYKKDKWWLSMVPGRLPKELPVRPIEDLDIDLRITIHPPLDAEKIKQLGTLTREEKGNELAKRRAHQKIVDHSMRVIKSVLPPLRQGWYEGEEDQTEESSEAA